MRRLSLLILIFTGLVSASKCPLKPPSSIRTSPLVIAHRGASFHVPEHTLAAYRLALELGADYIEPDLVGTKDGHLVVVHSIDLNITTNVAEVFPNRITTLPTTNTTGYYAHDFTLSEIRQLRVKQSLPTARTQLYDDMFGIPTFQETLELLEEWNEQILPLLTDEPTLQRAGLYVELKDPDIYQQMTNTSMVDIFMKELQTSKHAKFLQTDSVCESLKFNQYVPPPMVVQCFSAPTLEQLAKQWNYTTSLTSVLLIHGGPTCLENDFWFHVGESRDYIKGIGVEKKCLLSSDEKGGGNFYQEFMTKAEEYELAVHVWVERRELTSLAYYPNTMFHNLQQELVYLYCTVGIHGVFVENVADAVRVGQVGCHTNDTTTTTTTTGPVHTTNGNPTTTLCYTSDDEQAMYVGVAAGIMGILLGCIATLCISNSRFCRKRRAHQLVVPTQDPELEMV